MGYLFQSAVCLHTPKNALAHARRDRVIKNHLLVISSCSICDMLFVRTLVSDKSTEKRTNERTYDKSTVGETERREEKQRKKEIERERFQDEIN